MPDLFWITTGATSNPLPFNEYYCPIESAGIRLAAGIFHVHQRMFGKMGQGSLARRQLWSATEARED
jgi:hypothetical protein